MSKADYKFVSSYKKGDIVRFNRKYKQYKNDINTTHTTHSINKGDYLRVKAINEITNSLILEKNDKELLFYLKRKIDTSKIEVFTEVSLKLKEGLKIIFTKNNKQYGLVNSETAIIEKIEEQSLTLKLENGKSKAIPLSQLKHIDYGYCISIHSAQGKTYENTIAAISKNKLLNRQNSWIVTLSRHRSEFTALVEDKNQFRKYLASSKDNKVSAIELQIESRKSLSDLIQQR